MAYTMEGTIEIDLADFWEFVAKYNPGLDGETVYGIPRVNRSNGTLNIDFASSSEGNPTEWPQKPKAVKQWEDNKASHGATLFSRG